jgi:indole-3-glycerol phosphate synthase
VLSVLTDQKFFMGDLSYIKLCKEATDNQLPVLRKDFIVDRYQVVQARAYGADAILLIMACLDDTLAHDLFWLATKLKMAVLVEVHDAAELKRALQLGARIIGVNNRDLTSFKVDLNTTYQLAELLPADFDGILVSESGISTNTEIESLSVAGVEAVLIGETLVRAASTETGLDSQRVVQKIQELLNNL